MTNILGISAFYHDSAACLVRDGEIIAAAQEERFSRRKHDSSFPRQAVQYCLEEGGVSQRELDYIAFYDKPFVKFERIIETYLAYAPRGLKSFLMSMPLWIKKKILMSKLILDELEEYKGDIIFTQHHESHAASAFYPSPFKEAAFITIDGVGEWATASFGVGSNNSLDIQQELHFPHSLGLLYAAFTYYTGFKVNSDEYKVMGLAPYGKPKYVNLIYEQLLDLKQDGSFKLNMDYFNYCAGLTMTSEKFHKLFGGIPRRPGTKLTQRDMDLAASVQVVTEEIVLRMAQHVIKVTGKKNLCMAGGVALNCVANGKIFKADIFDNLWIQPAAGDAGGALGAALLVWYKYLESEREVISSQDKQRGSYLGPKFSSEYIESFLNKKGVIYKKYTDKELVDLVADLLIKEKIIGWFQGRMEFGPRALGNRSIIADARSSKMQSVLNLRIKFRESFRPFAPSVLRERVSEWFEIDRDSAYMLFTAAIRKDRQKILSQRDRELQGIDKLKVVRSDIPAVTHIDYSARIQTVKEKDNRIYYKLIKRFFEKTGYPMILNTSFNVREEPIVCNPEDAYNCFMGTSMDYLVMGNYLIDKRGQSSKELSLESDWG